MPSHVAAHYHVQCVSMWMMALHHTKYGTDSCARAAYTSQLASAFCVEHESTSDFILAK